MSLSEIRRMICGMLDHSFEFVNFSLSLGQRCDCLQVPFGHFQRKLVYRHTWIKRNLILKNRYQDEASYL